MTQQIQNNVDTILPSLEAKIRRFAGELTPEEQEQLRAMQPDDVSGMRSSPLWDKAQRAAGALTPEETEQLVRILERTGVTAPADGKADTQGYRAAAYEEDDGWKGKPGTNPHIARGGNSLEQVVGAGSLLLIAIGTVIFPGGRIVEGEIDAYQANHP